MTSNINFSLQLTAKCVGFFVLFVCFSLNEHHGNLKCKISFKFKEKSHLYDTDLMKHVHNSGYRLAQRLMKPQAHFIGCGCSFLKVSSIML